MSYEAPWQPCSSNTQVCFRHWPRVVTQSTCNTHTHTTKRAVSMTHFFSNFYFTKCEKIFLTAGGAVCSVWWWRSVHWTAPCIETSVVISSMSVGVPRSGQTQPDRQWLADWLLWLLQYAVEAHLSVSSAEKINAAAQGSSTGVRSSLLGTRNKYTLYHMIVHINRATPW